MKIICIFVFRINEINRMYTTSNTQFLHDYYKLLGINFPSSKQEIKTAFKSLAKEKHPDVMRNDEYGNYEEFIQIKEAYEVLSNKNNKEHYDFLYRKYILQEPYLKPNADGSCGTDGSCKTCGPNPDNATSGTRFLSFVIIIALILVWVLRGLI